MAKCEYCGREMITAPGCTCTKVKVHGKVVERMRYGTEDWFVGMNLKDIPERCYDCGCKIGEYHHPGCDIERCPVCNKQLLFHDALEEYVNYP